MQQSQRGPGLIQGRSELDLLTDHRNQLQRQVEELSSRRNVLFAQSRNADGATRGELLSRMSEIDGRLATLDGQIAAINAQISEGIARTGGGGGRNAPVIVDVPRIRTGQTITIPPINVQRGPDMREIAGMMAAEAVALALIGVMFWRLGMRRMREQFERTFANQSGQLNQLQNAVDVIGVEVERISEGQRYVAKVLSEGTPAARALVQAQQERQR